MKNTASSNKSTSISNIYKKIKSRFHSTVSNNEEINFKPNGFLTLGVEIELQLIDSKTYNLSSCAEDLLKRASHLKKIKPEFYLSTIEINTDICKDMHQVKSDLTETLSSLKSIGDDMGISFSTTGAHPFAKYSDCIISPSDRYQELIDRNQWLTRRMTVYGMHVHIGMASGDDCILYNNFFMYFLPHLLALSASSPFWQGIDTGLSSCRPTTYESLPTAGQPYYVKNWRDFTNLYDSLKRCDSIRSMKDLWWDLRPSPNYGTLEIRVCDGCATLYETLAITAFIHLLAHWFADNGSWMGSVATPPFWLSRENKWRAIRYGLDADLVINIDGKTRSIKEDMKDWMEKLQPYVIKLGYQEYFSYLSMLLENGVSSERQKKIYNKTESFEEVVKHNIKEFSVQIPQWEY